ncbi:MAG: hypothetical protein A2147_09040 [Chloroflexi bacterium RBG_16_57_8]|nr:MAG: hypothetical protein A2147_09040 [Chloroflexi bacterium RBG_16_57_8]
MAFEFGAMDHEYFMREALKEAELAARDGERPIGAVIVHNGRIIGKSCARHLSRRSDIAHAEMNAMLQAEQYLNMHARDGCIIYTTVEPCVMCLGAIVMSNIHHVVYGLADNWIRPGEMLEMDYVRRHIENYLGGVLAEASADLFEKNRPEDLSIMREGRHPGARP